MSAALLPRNASPMERAAADTLVPRCEPAAANVGQLWNPASCPAALLPWLAWALSVDDWDEAWPEAVKREVIAASIEIHRIKGTVAAVKRALDAVGRASQVLEWWQTAPQGAPHTFRTDIELDDRGLTESELLALERQVAAAKPVRSHFSVRLRGRSSGAATVGIGGQDWMTTTIYPQSP